MKAVYICFIYGINIFIVYWLDFYCKHYHDNVDCFLIDVSSMFNACKTAHLHPVAHALNTNAPSPRESFTRLKRLFTGWKRLFTAWKDYLQVEKDYLRLEKTIYGLTTIYGFDLVSSE